MKRGRKWDMFADGDTWGDIMNLGFQWCAYVSYDHDFENRECMISALNIVTDDLKYRAGVGDSEPDENDYFRIYTFPELSDIDIVEVGRFIRDTIDSIPEDDKY